MSAAARSAAGVLLALLACASCCSPHVDASGHSGAAQPGAAGNRDLHGPRDVESYIAGLESEARVQDLAPATVIEALALDEEAWIGDIGCGPGVFALRFARACPRGVVFAVDVEPAQLDRLRAHLLEQDVRNVVPVLASYSTPHLPPGRFDLLFIGDTYHHFEDRVAYVRALRELLRPDGRLAILEYKPGRLPVGPPPEHKLAPGELEKELTAAGYERVASLPTHAHHDFEIWRPRLAPDAGDRRP